ncbi:ribosome recycling factor [Candidatus Saccharibacteria bacterium]|nr:ribosome recycling factor [Candidatus Saccharibacteria bacterium]
MNPTQIISQTQAKLKAATDHFQEELKKLRTGRAHPSMLDSVVVQAYGSPMPLRAVGSISVPEGQLLQITPFDVDNLQAIANAIRDDQSLGLTPTDDGRVIRIQLPPMTSENRQAMVKVLHQKAEECLISARNARHEAQQTGWKAEQDKTIGKDEFERLKKQLDDLITQHKNQIDDLTKAKEQEILTV